MHVSMTRQTRRKSAPPAKSPARADRSWVAQGRAQVIGMLVIGFVLGVALTSGLKGVVAGQVAGPGTYQYGRLGVALTGVSWSTTDRHHAAEDLEELAGYITDSPHQGEMTPLELVNLVGSRGWELVSVSNATDPRDDDSYWFRRAVD